MSVIYRNANGTEDAITGSSDIVNSVQANNTNPITSGAVYTAIHNIKPTIYECKGFIVNAATDQLNGNGLAIVKCLNGFAEINFSYKITIAGTSSNKFDWGLNRDLLKQRNSNLPNITPIGTGICTIFNSNNGLFNQELSDYASYSIANGQFWTCGRVYTSSGDKGTWPTSQMTVGIYVTGTCYGTYTE